MKKLFVATDHAGFDFKEAIKKAMPEVEWIDLGPFDAARVDYPDYADRVAQRVLSEGGQGLLICGSGQGMAMRANKYQGIRAALAWSEDSAILSRAHNDANILCLGARLIDLDLAKRLINTFTETSFEGGRHADRIKKIDRPT